MVTRSELYARVNNEWPAEVPPLSAEEATKAARRLYRFATGRKLTIPIKIVSGNRYTWARRGTLFVNPNRKHHGGGWQSFIHDYSHWLHNITTTDAPHAKSHARLEQKLIKQVVRRGWLAGKLHSATKPAKPKPDLKALRYERMLNRHKVWQKKFDRAERALKKLNRQIRSYKRSMENVL